MATIQFEDGTKVNFEGDPTPQDIEEVAQKLNLSGNNQGNQNTGSFIGTTLGNIPKAISNFVGTTGLGKGISTVLAPDQIQDINRISQSSQKFLDLAHQLPVNNPRRQKLLELAQQTANEAQTLGQQNIESIPTNKEVLGSAAQTGLSLATLGGLGTGGKLGAQVLKGSVLGAGFGAAGALEANKTPGLGDITTGAAIGGAIPLAGAGLNKLKSFIGESLPKSLINTYLPSNKDLSQHVLENTKLGFTKTMLNNAKSNVKNISNEIGDILDETLAPATFNPEATRAQDIVNTKKLFKSVAQSFSQVGGAGTITSNEVKKQILKIVPEVRGLLNKDNITLQQTWDIDKKISLALGDRFFEIKHSPFAKQVAGNFNETSRELIKEVAPKTIPLFDELSKEINVRNGLNKYTKRMGRVTLTDLISAMSGAGVFVTQGPLRALGGAAGAIIAERALRSPAVGIGAAKGFTKLGQVALPRVVRQATKLGVLRGATAGSQ